MSAAKTSIHRQSVYIECVGPLLPVGRWGGGGEWILLAGETCSPVAVSKRHGGVTDIFGQWQLLLVLVLVRLLNTVPRS